MAISGRTPLFVLIHAPLVGPYTWSLTAESLGRYGFNVAQPVLASSLATERPFWRHHAQAVIAALARFDPTAPVILVAHSGAGPLLPAIGDELRANGHSPTAYLFADAGFPVAGMSRLDLMEQESPGSAEAFRRSAQAGLLPVWTDEDLRDVIPDDAVRARFTAELRPLPLAVYEEPLPVFSGWPDAPGAYLRFGQNPAYDSSARQAEALGWPSATLPGEHFEMLVHPEAVAQALISLARRMGIPGLEGTIHA